MSSFVAGSMIERRTGDSIRTSNTSMSWLCWVMPAEARKLLLFARKRFKKVLLVFDGVLIPAELLLVNNRLHKFFGGLSSSTSANNCL